MNKCEREGYFIFIAVILLGILLLTRTNVVQNKGIVQFGDYTEDAFGCLPGMTDKDGCLAVQKQWQLNQNMINNTVSYGQFANVQGGEEIVLDVAKVSELKSKEPTHESNSGVEIHEKNLGAFAEHIYIQEKIDDGISLKKPDVDMRDIAMNEWRQGVDEQMQKPIMADLRAYQQEYNEQLEKNKFKTMSMDDHRKQNIEEWKERVNNTTAEALKMKPF